MGLPGCLGSMGSLACPFELRHHCIGRYGNPTLGFNLICSFVRTIEEFSIYRRLSLVLPMTAVQKTIPACAR